MKLPFNALITSLREKLGSGPVPPQITRLAMWLRHQLYHRYSSAWEDQYQDVINEPEWLQALWRRCGVKGLPIRVFRIPAWTFEAGIDSPKAAHLRELAGKLKESSGIHVPTAEEFDKSWRQLTKPFPEGLSMRPPAGNYNLRTQSGANYSITGVDWGAGGSKPAVTILPGAKMASMDNLLGIPMFVTTALPTGVDAAMVSLPDGGQIIKSHVVLLKLDRKDIMQIHRIQILRRADLKPDMKEAPHHLVKINDFDTSLNKWSGASEIVFIDGIYHKVFKQSWPGQRKYFASYFRSPPHAMKVVDGRLVVAVKEDSILGFADGTLICQPWTPEDGNAAAQDDDVLGATLTFEDQMFHDRGVFISALGFDAPSAEEAPPELLYVVERTDKPGTYLEWWGDENCGPVWTTDLSKVEGQTLVLAEQDSRMTRPPTRVVPHPNKPH